jgi:hypothetical protein
LCQFLGHKFFILIDIFLIKPRARAQNFDPNTPETRFPKFSFDMLEKNYVMSDFYVTKQSFFVRGNFGAEVSLHLSLKLALYSRIRMKAF